MVEVECYSYVTFCVFVVQYWNTDRCCEKLRHVEMSNKNNTSLSLPESSGFRKI